MVEISEANQARVTQMRDTVNENSRRLFDQAIGELKNLTPSSLPVLWQRNSTKLAVALRGGPLPHLDTQDLSEEMLARLEKERKVQSQVTTIVGMYSGKTELTTATKRPLSLEEEILIAQIRTKIKNPADQNSFDRELGLLKGLEANAPASLWQRAVDHFIYYLRGGPSPTLELNDTTGRKKEEAIRKDAYTIVNIYSTAAGIITGGQSKQ